MVVRAVEMTEGARRDEIGPGWPLWPTNLDGFWAAARPDGPSPASNPTNFVGSPDQPEKPKSGNSLTPTGKPSLICGQFADPSVD